MSRRPLLCLYQEHTSDLEEALKLAARANYDVIITPNTNPLFYREFNEKPLSERHSVFTRSDLILNADQWMRRFVSKINDGIDCDSRNENVRRHSERVFHQEFSLAKHLGENGCSLVRLKSENCVNLAHLIGDTEKNREHNLLVEVPMIDPRVKVGKFRREISKNREKISDTWLWWNRLRSTANFYRHLRVVLEISTEMPSEEQILRWLGEPIELVAVPMEVFEIEEEPGSWDPPTVTLPEAHKQMLGRFCKKQTVHFAVKCNIDNENLVGYANCLLDVIRENTITYAVRHAYSL